MRHSINLRQIETFKALIETGTVSRAAEVIYISQPAASKLLMQIEEENGLKLFDRQKGRLIPTSQGLRLYEEISRIFAGVRQIESAVAFIKREDQGRLIIGLIPALAGKFIQQTTMNFLKLNPNVDCSIISLGAQWISDRLLTRTLDVGISSGRIDNPALVAEPLSEHPLICVMPVDHPLTKLKTIRPVDLNDVAYVSFKADSYTGRKVVNLFEKYDIRPNIVLTADANQTAREFVCAGLGVALMHPLFVIGIEDRVAVRPFEPAIPIEFQLRYAQDARNAKLIAEFVKETQAMAAHSVQQLTKSWS